MNLHRFSPSSESGVFAALPDATDDQAESHRGCVLAFIHERMTDIVGADGGMSANEAWVHRFLLESIEALDGSAMHTAMAAKKAALG